MTTTDWTLDLRARAPRHHERSRDERKLTFNELKALFDVSDGNLGAHARKLEKPVTSLREVLRARRPKSRYRITQSPKALLRYLEHIEASSRRPRN